MCLWCCWCQEYVREKGRGAPLTGPWISHEHHDIPSPTGFCFAEDWGMKYQLWHPFSICGRLTAWLLYISSPCHSHFWYKVIPHLSHDSMHALLSSFNHQIHRFFFTLYLWGKDKKKTFYIVSFGERQEEKSSRLIQMRFEHFPCLWITKAGSTPSPWALCDGPMWYEDWWSFSLIFKSSSIWTEKLFPDDCNYLLLWLDGFG